MMRATLRTIRAALLLLIAASLSSAAGAQQDQRRLVSTATLTLSGFLNDPDMHWLRNNFQPGQGGADRAIDHPRRIHRRRIGRSRAGDSSETPRRASGRGRRFTS